MSYIGVNQAKCKKDGICIEACPAGCLEAGAEGFPQEVEGTFCIDCGHCVAVCPHGALSHARLPEKDFSPAPKLKVKATDMEALMKSRRSVREFKDESIPRETLDKLLDIARYAPTAVNYQKVSWIVTQERAKITSINKVIADWMRRNDLMPAYLAMWDKGRDVILRGASNLAVACAPADYNWAAEDCAIALSYMELAAATMGLGVCWAGILTRAAQADPAVARALSVPEGQKVCGGLMLGVPKYRYNLIPPRNAVKVAWI
jgi:nitroreductase/NAD-dependent dihydropyrimidine dehydrogenase PreA subunit